MNSGELTGLLAAARGGNRRALDELLERCSPKLLGLIRLRLGALRSRLESQDVLQTTLLKAFSGLEALEGHGSRPLMAWLATIADNEIRDQTAFHRAQRRDMKLDEPLDATGGLDVASLKSAVRTVTSELVLRQDLLRLHALIETLDEPQREVVLLRSFEELGYREIGERLGRTADACRMLYARALAALVLRMRQNERASASRARSEP